MKKSIVIGKNIVRLRKRKNITQEELATKTGWTRVQISRYEHGEIKRINYEFLIEIAKALDVTIKELEEEKDVEK